MSVTVLSLSLVIGRLLPEPHAGLLNGILFGTKSSIPADLTANLITTGVIHIAALSGMNISLVTGFLGKIINQIVSKRITCLIMILGIIWFVSFVGVSPSVVRAAIMSSLTLIAIIFGRESWAILSWILAVSIMLLLNIRWIADLSFQLSALATLGIILFSQEDKIFFDPQLAGYSKAQSRINQIGGINAIQSSNQLGIRSAKILSSFVHIIKSELHLTLSAQVLTIPLIFLHFHRISVVSPLTNILIGWTILPVSLLGWLAALLGNIWLPLGKLPAILAWGLLQYLITIVNWIAMTPFASVSF